MSALHNNGRRHRQLFKKRVLNDFNANEIIEKRSPPPNRIGNPPQVSQDAIPPVVAPTANPTGPASGPKPPVGTNTPASSNTPVRPSPPATTSKTTPQVPVPPTAQSSTDTSSTTISSSSVVSSTTSSSVSVPTNAATTVVAAPTTQLPTYNAPTTYSVPSVTAGGLTDTASAPSATFSSSTSNNLSTGSVVGIVAASLIAVAALVVVGMWLTKRYFKERDEAEFNRNSFIRQSVHIPDNEDDYRSPRPPTMIERHNGAYGAQQPVYGNNMYAPPVPPMPTIQPGEMMMANHSSVANPFAAGPVDHYGMPIQQQPSLVRVPSNGSAHSYNGGNGAPVNDPQGQYQQYSPQNQNMALEERGAHGQTQGYADLQRSSVTPYQAAQYAEISRQLNISSVSNSPVTPSFGQSQGYGAEHLSPDTGRLPTPAPQRAMSPQAESQRVISPLQRVMSPNSVPVGGYAFPMPLSSTPPSQAPASVAHASAMAALGINTNALAKSAVSPQAAPAQLHPQGHAHEEVRPVSTYQEEDAYGGM